MKQDRNKITEAMAKFKQRVIPDKRDGELQRQADRLVADAFAGRSDVMKMATPEQAAEIEAMEAERNPVAKAIEVLAEAAGATLTPEELAALKQERKRDDTICPRCHCGYAGGLGWNVQRDKCGACGYSGKRRPQVEAKAEWDGVERRDPNTATIPLHGKPFYQPADGGRMKPCRRKVDA